MICSSNYFEKYRPVAETLFVDFVKTYSYIYGSENLTYNIHSVIHVVEDVRLYGELDLYSAFPFENKLGWIQRLLRTGHKQLQQLYKRIEEKRLMEYKPHSTVEAVSFKEKNGTFLNLIINGFFYNSIKNR